MAETAAHLVDHVIPAVPVRQWVLSLPKRLHWHLHRDLSLATAVLRLFLRAVERTLLTHTKTAAAGARIGAVSFIHRFGAAHNPHTHYHCCVTDGAFSGDAAPPLIFASRTSEGSSWRRGRLRGRSATTSLVSWHTTLLPELEEQ